MKKYIPYLTLSFIVALISFFTLIKTQPMIATASFSKKLTVCHKTASQTNPWVVQTIKANELQSHLDNGDFLIDKAHSCPPVEPTATPTPTAEVTPTIDPCEGNLDIKDEFIQNCVTPTPTEEVTPTETPEVTPTPENGGSSVSAASYNAPTCNGSLPNKPLLQGFKANGNGSVSFSWWPVDADKYSIRYGYSLDALNMGVPSIPSTSTSITLDGLQPGKSVWAILTAYKGECAIDSSPLDPKVK